MRIGDVVTARTFEERVSKPKDSPGLTGRRMSAPKGRHFVFLVLGSEPADGSAPLDVDARLNEMGLVLKSTVAPVEASARGGK